MYGQLTGKYCKIKFNVSKLLHEHLFPVAAVECEKTGATTKQMPLFCNKKSLCVLFHQLHV